MTKEQVRQTAREHNLVTAAVAESQEVCFVVDNDYRRFLGEYAPDRLSGVGEGEILSEEGEVLGKHPGHTYFTVGQRRRIGLANQEPLYVKEIDPEANRITVAPRPSLFGTACEVEQINWLVDPPAEPVNVHARVRYNSAGAAARLTPEGRSVRLEFEIPQLAITPGQSAVFYGGDVVLGGGIIGRRIGA
jgi:tRNA-specific 2-thiouridylase